MRDRWLVLVLVAPGCFSEGGGASTTAPPGTSDTGSSTEAPTSSGTMSTSTTDPTADVSSDTGADTTTGADDMCPFDSVLLPPVPAGWIGISYVVSLPSDAPPPDCPLLFDDSLLQLGPESMPDGACDCDCDVAVTDLCTMSLQLAGSCERIGGVPDDPLGAECVENTPPAANVTTVGQPFMPVGVPRYGDGVLYACSRDAEIMCAPRPDDFIGPCIRSTSETMCPLGYPEKHTAWDTVCDECPAPDTETYCADLRFDWFIDDACEGGTDSYLPVFPECTEDGTRHSIRLAPVPLDCPATSGVPQETTICCFG